MTEKKGLAEHQIFLLPASRLLMERKEMRSGQGKSKISNLQS
jgi:hypothetical protein